MELKDFFEKHNKVALAFSGGVDSVYLLYAAVKYGVEVTAYYVKTQFQPLFELNDAKRAAEEIGAELKVIDYDILQHKGIVENTGERCYYCKGMLFNAIIENASVDGYTTVIDGTNASDMENDRPGMRALRELKVLSPLRECGITKEKIRELSRLARLFTWDKPAYACLATRIPTGEVITEDKLFKVEAGENILFRLGFSDFRIRLFNGAGRIQVPAEQMNRLLCMRETIVKDLQPYFDTVLLDLKGR